MMTLAVCVDAIRRHHVRAVRVDLDPHDHPVAIERQRRVVNVEIAVVLEVGIERHRVEPLLDEARLHVVAERVDRGQVEERIVLDGAVLVDDLDAPDALDDEDAARAVASIRDVHWIVESLGHLDERDLRIARQRAAGLCDLVRRLWHLLREGPRRRRSAPKAERGGEQRFHDSPPQGRLVEVGHANSTSQTLRHRGTFGNRGSHAHGKRPAHRSCSGVGSASRGGRPWPPGPARAARSPRLAPRRRCLAAGEQVFHHWPPVERLRWGYGMSGRDEVAARCVRRRGRAGGDARAMFNYGLMLLRGQRRCAPIRRSGRDWIERSFGMGVGRRRAGCSAIWRGRASAARRIAGRAAAYYRLAADAGDVRGMHALANMHIMGRRRAARGAGGICLVLACGGSRIQPAGSGGA